MPVSHTSRGGRTRQRRPASSARPGRRCGSSLRTTRCRASAPRLRPTGWLTCAAPAAGRLYLDPAGTWDALSLGWSLKEHHTIRMSCRPWIELLASIGLQAFPVPGHRARGGFHYNL